MAKARIYELAKQLNTTSKRLMEKLGEINIKVKNHMSLLQDEELNALYNYIGIVKKEEVTDIKKDENKIASNEVKEEVKKQSKAAQQKVKSGPRIIRTREIIINTEKEQPREQNKSRDTNRGNNQRRNVANATSGLRQGYVYGNNDYSALITNASKNKEKNKESVVQEVKKEEVKKDNIERKQIQDTKKVTKNEVKKSESSIEVKSQDVKNEKSLKDTKPVEQNRNNINAKSRSTDSRNNNQRVNRPFNSNSKGTYKGNNNVVRTLENSKSNQSEIKKEELNKGKSEIKREVVVKDAQKEGKRDQKKENVSKSGGFANKTSKYAPKKIFIGEKKGVSEILSEDSILNEFYDADLKGIKKNKNRRQQKTDNRRQEQQIPKPVITVVKIGEYVTVKELAEAMKKTAAEVIKKLMALGVMVTVNSELDFDTAVLLGEEFKVKVEKAVVVNEEDILFNDEEEEDTSKMVARPPVVVVMGHVDHGKTSLLDAIRKTSVTTGEAGGITQHIGAHIVKINNKSITFLDTPGHEAFTAMRARGAQVTDIAILVVAADDGVMPQTIEAINHAKAANVAIIVAINKIDKPGANPDKVKQELTEYGLVAEEWGGDTICVPVSAKEHKGIENLLEMITLVSEMLELKANPESQAKGTIIEAKLDKDRGPIATLLVQKGTLKTGDSIITGVTVGRIRAMVDDKGRRIKKAGPSTPVEILGLHEVPEAGEIFYAITDEKLAKSLIEKRKLKQREQHLRSSAKVSLEELYDQIKAGNVKDLNLIVKADVQGSVEAVKQSLQKLSTDEVRINIIHGAVGAITEHDVTLAQVSNAIIIGFNVRPSTNVTEIAKDVGVDMRLYRIIYNAIEDIEAAMKGMLDPTFKEVVTGHIEIRQTFKVSGVGTIGGAYVTDGKVLRNSEIRIVRDGIVVHEGSLASLKRFKDDVKEVQQGFECGVAIENFNDIKIGDVVEAFVMEEVKR